MTVWAINAGESDQEVIKFIENFLIEMPVLLDRTQSVYLTYKQFGGPSPFPLDYIVDQQGVIRYRNVKYEPLEMMEIIDELLGL